MGAELRPEDQGDNRRPVNDDDRSTGDGARPVVPSSCERVLNYAFERGLVARQAIPVESDFHDASDA